MQDVFKQFDFPVAADEPFQRVRKLPELRRRQIAQRAIGQIDQRQAGTPGDDGNFREKLGGFFGDGNRSAAGNFRDLFRAEFFPDVQQ